MTGHQKSDPLALVHLLFEQLALEALAHLHLFGLVLDPVRAPEPVVEVDPHVGPLQSVGHEVGLDDALVEVVPVEVGLDLVRRRRLCHRHGDGERRLLGAQFVRLCEEVREERVGALFEFGVDLGVAHLLAWFGYLVCREERREVDRH